MPFDCWILLIFPLLHHADMTDGKSMDSRCVRGKRKSDDDDDSRWQKAGHRKAHVRVFRVFSRKKNEQRPENWGGKKATDFSAQSGSWKTLHGLKGRGSILKKGRWVVDIELRNFVQKRFIAYLQYLGCFASVPAGFVQNVQNSFTFDFVQSFFSDILQGKGR